MPPKILNMTVPQVGQRPLMALRPFFIISSTASEISFLALHLTQYPSGIKLFYSKRLTRLAMRIPYGAAVRSVNSENRCQHGRHGQIPKPEARSASRPGLDRRRLWSIRSLDFFRMLPFEFPVDGVVPVLSLFLSPTKPEVTARLSSTARRSANAPYRVPIPTLCTVWKSLPSVLMLGAMMISVS